MKHIMLLALMLIFVGCNSGSGGSSQAAPKRLFSVWTHVDSGITLDLTDGSLGSEESFYVNFPGGEICGCKVLATGTESDGEYDINSCIYIMGGSGSDPGCSALHSVGIYENDGTTLSICTYQGCENYN